MKLVIIESPGKREALKKYLGGEYEVMSSKGHVRDLPPKNFGVDLLHNFNPAYEILADKKTTIADLKKKAKEAEQVFLATDPDREGEAISWHIAYCLGIEEHTPCRIEFNEISKKAVVEALSKPRCINLNLVDAQQTRRILDRMVGYKLSPILCKKIAPKLSAGRVQSVALKLVVDREKEIRDFKPEEYWNITAHLKKDGNAITFKASLVDIDGKKAKVKNKEQADTVSRIASSASFKVEKIKKSKTKSHAPAPFTTSTMQQDALNKLGMDLKKTSSCAQALYEGVDIGDEGKVALITYIRSDSTRVSADAQNSAREFISHKYGEGFIPAKPNFYKSKANAQDAHEAIRPINVNRTPESVKSSLSNDNYKLYKLIYERFLASQMSEALYNSVQVDINAKNLGFKATGRTLEFAGWTSIYKEFEDKQEDKEGNVKIPPLDESDILNLEKLDTEQKFTKPPQRYTEATLVKAMEEKGIGRPATYAPTITVLSSRTYTSKEGKSLKPTELGEKVVNYLDEYFKSVINVKFTACMESRLDKIAEVGEDWHTVLANFWSGFKELLKKADSSSAIVKKEPIKSDVLCEKCGAEMFVRESRYGKFLGCSNYPKCKNIVSLTQQTTKEVGKCPECHKPMTLRKSKKGKPYYACTGYPDCKFMSWDAPNGEKCKKCGSAMVLKGKGEEKTAVCSNAECK